MNINHTKKRKTMNFQTVIPREQFKSKIIQTNCITETGMWGKRPAAMLAIYTGRGESQRTYTGRARLIRSHLSARFCFELSGNSN